MSAATKPKRGKAKGMEGITKRGDSYYVRVRLNGKPTSLGSYADPEDAKAARDTAQAAAHKGASVATTAVRKLTVGDLAADHLAANAHVWSYRTRRNTASQWRMIAPVFGDVPVVALRASHVSDWLAALAGDGLAQGTIRNRLVLLRAILDRASADHGVVNVARLAKLPRKRRPAGMPVARYAFTPEDIAAVLATFTRRYRIVAQLQVHLGLRSGEARGLTLDRVDFSTGAIRIDRQLCAVRVGDTPEGVDLLTPACGFGPLKTSQSYGTVWAPADLLDAIAAHVEEYGTGPDGLIASASDGGPLGMPTYNSEAARVARVTGVPFRPHDLRHTRGSWALADGASIADVATDLRHSVPTAVRTYLHAERPVDASRSEGIAARLAAADARKPRAKGHLRAVG